MTLTTFRLPPEEAKIFAEAYAGKVIAEFESFDNVKRGVVDLPRFAKNRLGYWDPDRTATFHRTSGSSGYGGGCSIMIELTTGKIYISEWSM